MALERGGQLRRRGKYVSLVAKPKRHDVLFEDRVWTLLFRMGFDYLSGDGGTFLVINPGNEHPVHNQLDVVAIDTEVCVAVECKSSVARARRPSMQEDLGKLAAGREPLSRALSGRGPKRQLVHVLWTENAIVSANDRERATQLNVTLLDEADLAYYETLTHHLGEAARYQLLADLLTGKPILGLSIRVPALKAKMGGYTCYTFSASPEYLLKIAYVSHRARGKRSDVRTYQRMLSRSRLRKIAAYIAEPGSIFPTNIILNLEPGRRGSGASFERSQQAEGAVGATFGWLSLRPSYKSAWLIDGQHRLYAYSGSNRAASSTLSVLAFEGLPGSVQQQLFVDINAEQKSVKRSLLQELYADLHRTSADPSKRIQAVISEAVQALGQDPDSPLYDRVQLSESVRTATRCISLTSVFGALDKPGFFFAAQHNNVVVDPGPFWASNDDAMVKRVCAIIASWLGAVREHAPDWWDLGAAEGGGLAMNDGVTVCISVLRSVADHLGAGRARWADQSTAEVVARLMPYANALGEYFGAMSSEDRLAFRSLRGIQGQTTGTRHAQQFVQQRFPAFQPDGLADFVEREKAKTNDRAASVVSEIERNLGRAVIGRLKVSLGEEGENWWYEGVPRTVRTPVTERQEDDKNQAGSKEAYLDLIDYREIIRNNWPLFGGLLAYGKGGSKDRRTEWIVRVNEIRKIAMHASRGASVSFEQVSELEGYAAWLRGQMAAEGEVELNVDSGSEAEAVVGGTGLVGSAEESPD